MKISLMPLKKILDSKLINTSVPLTWPYNKNNNRQNALLTQKRKTSMRNMNFSLRLCGVHKCPPFTVEPRLVPEMTAIRQPYVAEIDILYYYNIKNNSH